MPDYFKAFQYEMTGGMLLLNTKKFPISDWELLSDVLSKRTRGIWYMHTRTINNFMRSFHD